MGKNFRQRVISEKEKLLPEDVFTSASYQKMLKGLTRVLTDSDFNKVSVSLDCKSGLAGSYGPDGIVLYIRNPLTKSFPTMELKNRSIVGILAHECGHRNYSSIEDRIQYLAAIEGGMWYPEPPTAENEKEKDNFSQMMVCFSNQDKTALHLIGVVASAIQNQLEDVFIEGLMCSKFEGSICHGIQQNRERKLEQIPSLKEQFRAGHEHLAVMINLVVQYALSGEYNNWDEYQGELLDVLESVKPVIDAAVTEKNQKGRIIATNRILLKMWKILQDKIAEIEKQQEEEQEEGEKESEEGEEAAKKKNYSAKEEGAESSAVEKAVEQLFSQMPDFMRQTGERECVNQNTMDEKGNCNRDAEAFKADIEENDAESAGVKGEKNQDAKSDERKGGCRNITSSQNVDVDVKLQDILYEMAKGAANHQVFQESLSQVQRELDEVEFREGHNEVQKVLKRAEDVKEESRQDYKVLYPKVKKTTQHLKASVFPILQMKENRIEHKLFMGKKIDGQNLTNQSGKIFQKKRFRGTDSECAVAILLDLSNSMRGRRIENAKAAAVCLYEFCRMMQIPVAVYGHHTDGFEHSRLHDERVFLHSCAEFEPDDDDRYRIMQLKPYGANRDGAALTYMGAKLLKRPERQKILILVSDGLPNASYYKGKSAMEDLIRIKKHLRKKGIIFLAAAIGEDKKVIEQIYQEAFLDISDLERMPAILSKKMLHLIRRT